MVYRALGEVDRALDGVDEGDAAQVLKVIERFAIECSINKVATSEALAYVVDEAVQVFGGNGYSREFPVERAYRDARITRIYEGTNEINRLIIPTRLLKQADALFGTAATSRPRGAAFAAEHELLAGARRLAIAALRTLSEVYGDGVKDEQEVLAHAANIIIEIYAIESAVARAEKLATAGSSRTAVAADVARVYASDAADRIAHAGKQILNAIPETSGRTGELAMAVAEVVTHRGTDTVSARRRIGDAAIDAGRYPFH
jgi:alkylation response protein AidB-like acyl-CoA dehydrogenase